MKEEFSEGQQPCKDYRAQDDGFGGNRHDCYCKDNKGEYCPLTVSFCLNCSNDHHSRGYDKCVCGGKGRAKAGTPAPKN